MFSLDKLELVFTNLFQPALFLSPTGHAEFHCHTETGTPTQVSQSLSTWDSR